MGTLETSKAGKLATLAMAGVWNAVLLATYPARLAKWKAGGSRQGEKPRVTL
jgi:hypothetical protein